MKNTNMNNTNMTGRRTRRNCERARAITKAKARKTNILIAVAAIGLAAVIGASAFAFTMLSNQTAKTADTAPTAISMKADANKAAQNTKQAAQTAQTAQAVQSNENTQAAPAVQTAPAAQYDNQNTQTVQSTQSTQPAQDTPHSEDKIETVNGERVYIDTKRTAPDKTGAPAHYYANGKTSYGFDWDYSGGGNFVLRCDYNFDQQQYDFQFYGVTPGTATTTLYYFTDDNTKVPVSLNVTVDSDLNVTLG